MRRNCYDLLIQLRKADFRFYHHNNQFLFIWYLRNHWVSACKCTDYDTLHKRLNMSLLASKLILEVIMWLWLRTHYVPAGLTDRLIGENVLVSYRHRQWQFTGVAETVLSAHSSLVYCTWWMMTHEHFVCFMYNLHSSLFLSFLLIYL